MLKLEKMENELDQRGKRIDQAYYRQRETDELVKKVQNQMAEAFFERNNFSTEVRNLREENEKLRSKINRKKNKITQYMKELDEVNGIIAKRKEQLDETADAAAKLIMYFCRKFRLMSVNNE